MADAVLSEVQAICNKLSGQWSRTCTALLLEAHVFDKLIKCGVWTVRSFEAAPVDGLIPISKLGGDNMPSHDVSPAQKLRWLQYDAPSTTRFLAIDVKSFSLLPRSHKQLAFAFSPSVRTTVDAAVYLLVSDGLPCFTAVVPKQVYEDCGDSYYGQGVLPLLMRVPSWMHPFMVHDNDLKLAMDNIIDVANGKKAFWVNPSLDITLESWNWKPTSVNLSKARTLAKPGSAQNQSAYMAIEQLWKSSLQSAGIEFHLNDNAPLLCDFLFEIEGLRRHIRIEHKLGFGIVLRAHEKLIERSPFSPARVWHHLIMQPSRHCGYYYCIARHEVQAGWERADNTEFAFEDRPRYFGPAGFENLRDFIKATSSQAVAAADEAAQSLSAIDLSLSTCLGERRPDLYEAMVEQEEQADEKARNRKHARALPWLCRKINEQCARLGKQFLCLPLDFGNPYGNHIFVAFDWSNLQLEENGAFPIFPASPELKDSPCVILRFLDCFKGPTSNSFNYPIHFRRAFWTRLASAQHFVVVGSTFDDTTCSLVDDAPMPYLVLPSQALTLVKPENIMPRPQPHAGQQYFTTVSLTEDVAQSPPMESSHAVPLKKGCQYLKDRDLQPLNFLFDLSNGAVYRALCQFLDQDRDVVQLQAASTTKPAPKFPRKAYTMLVKDVLQGQITYGVRRKPASLAAND